MIQRLENRGHSAPLALKRGIIGFPMIEHRNGSSGLFQTHAGKT